MLSPRDLEKAQFYAGRSGGSPIEILLISEFTLCLIYWLSITSSKLFTGPVARILFEVTLLPILLYFAICRPSMYLLLAFLPLALNPVDSVPDRGRSVRLACVRLTVVFLTTICIIFVDFPSFPSRHAKVSRPLAVFGSSVLRGELLKFESNGSVFLGLMDVGAAHFVILNGFATISFRKSIRKAIVNFFFWFARSVATKSTNYFTPDGEYTKYCNFFGYLGGVHLIAALLSPTGMSASVLCVIWIVLYEATKVPFLGYVILFYFANAIGFEVSGKVQMVLSLLSVLLCQVGVTRPLREAMNVEFCLYVFATVDLGLAIGRLFRLRYEDLSGFVRAVDENPLFFFLVANVVTGVINMTIDANHSSAIWAFGAVLLVFWVSSIATLFLAGKRVAKI
jgi:hypothetical protein